MKYRVKVRKSGPQPGGSSPRVNEAGAETMAVIDKVVMVTGASRGIGAQTALAFAGAGARVVLFARDAPALAALAERIGPAALAVAGDVARWDDVAGAVARTEARFGRLDVLVNNAGVVAPISPLDRADPAAWAALIDINVKGVFHGVRAALPGMLARRGGTILTVSSGAAHRPMDGWSAYCASKAAVAMLTQSLHLEYQHRGIRALGLAPGTVATDMQRAIRASDINAVSQLDWSAHIPPEWVARALVWMAGPVGRAGKELSLRDEALRREIGLPV